MKVHNVQIGDDPRGTLQKVAGANLSAIEEIGRSLGRDLSVFVIIQDETMGGPMMEAGAASNMSIDYAIESLQAALEAMRQARGSLS